MRTTVLLGAGGLAVLIAGSGLREARACGGCFHEPPQPSQIGSVVTDHRMIFSVAPQQTTLYDQIKYSGAPNSFAWVLPIHAPVTVGLSSDTVFQALEQVTQTQIVSPPLQCPQAATCQCGGAFAGQRRSANGSDHSVPPVNVLSEQTVGPYETVQLRSTDPNALTAWLTANGYVIPADIQPILATYVSEQFDFLALRLRPGQGVNAMRPVRVTTPGAALSLPLRMVAAGTGATVGITLWVIAEGRYEPKNFPIFAVDPSELTWDFAGMTSDYSTIVTQREASLMNAAWQIESSIDQSATAIESTVLQSSGDYVDTPGGDAGPGSTASQARFDDLGALFPQSPGIVRITRLRADLAHPALAADLELQAAADQSQLSNIYTVTRSVNAPSCPPVSPCPPCDSGGRGIVSCSASAPGNGRSGGALLAAGILAMAAAWWRARRRGRGS